MDDEHYQDAPAEAGTSRSKNVVNGSFINKLKDFSTFNPSGNKGRERAV
jgi:hypothetical protein